MGGGGWATTAAPAAGKWRRWLFLDTDSPPVDMPIRL